jgi:hypothetical protein
MRKIHQFSTVIATFLLVLSIGFPAADVAVSTPDTEKLNSGHLGSRSLGVSVSSEGDALDNVPVTIINDKTGSQVFSGFTDSAGQVDVTLPQGKYQVVVQGQKTKTVNLNKDQNVSFELASDERPEG